MSAVGQCEDKSGAHVDKYLRPTKLERYCPLDSMQSHR